MSERLKFPYSDPDVEIILQDGCIWIETLADYGDSESGWGQASKTIFFDSKALEDLIEFIRTHGQSGGAELEWRRAEIERLRAGLRAIAEYPQGQVFSAGFAPDDAENMQAIACRTLEQQSGGAELKWQRAEIKRLRTLLEDAVETLEAMDLYTNNPLYNRLVLALEQQSGGAELPHVKDG